MRQLSMEQVDLVSGASFGDYVGAVVGAVCGALTRGVGGATACAVAGVATTDLVDSLADAEAPDMGSYYDNMPPGMQ